MQTVDAAAFRGKRVRYRAAVRTGELGEGTGAQLWCRIDRPKSKDGERQPGAFDNMQQRRITGDAWQRFDVVLDVAADATNIALGVFVLGKGKVWFGDVSFEVVDESVKTTASWNPSRSSRSGYQMPDAVRAALAKAQDAPQQPFWTWWLVLPALATAECGSLHQRRERPRRARCCIDADRVEELRNLLKFEISTKNLIPEVSPKFGITIF